jgi:bifunctional non-homologous end joining protein LigD
MSATERTIGRYRVRVSKPDKVLFPDDGITKLELVDYYARVAEHMLPHLARRPIAMERYPDGVAGFRIFQKDVPTHFPDWVARVELRKRDGSLHHVVVDKAATLAFLADQACITQHAFLSRIDRIDHPDQLIFDLDPPGDDFDLARRVALDVRALLEDELGLPTFVKTSGGDGLHVVVPLDRSEDFGAVRAFALEVAEVLVRRAPDRLTLEVRKVKRGDRLFLDLGRNAYAQTAVAPYTVRARPGAPVATPLAWREVRSARLHPGRFTIRTIFRRLGRTPDPWADLGRRRVSLRRARQRLARVSREGG